MSIFKGISLIQILAPKAIKSSSYPYTLASGFRDGIYEVRRQARVVRLDVWIAFWSFIFFISSILNMNLMLISKDNTKLSEHHSYGIKNLVRLGSGCKNSKSTCRVIFLLYWWLTLTFTSTLGLFAKTSQSRLKLILLCLLIFKVILFKYLKLKLIFL